MCLIKMLTNKGDYITDWSSHAVKHCVERVTDLQAVSRGLEGGNSSDRVV